MKNLDFGTAVSLMKTGKHLQRRGWNGKGMHVYIADFEGCEPCFVLYTASKTYQPGWNASTPDILADDWQVVDGNENYF